MTDDLEAGRAFANLPGERGAARTILHEVADLLPVSPASEPTRSRQGTDLSRYTDRLKLLNDVHLALAREVTLEALLALILERTCALLNPEEAVILVSDDSGEFQPVAARRLPGIHSEPFYSTSLMREVVEKRVGALVLDAQEDIRFAAAQSIKYSGVRSLLAAPLLDLDRGFGAIVLSSRGQARQFTEEDLELLVSVASVAALRIRNVSLAREAAEKRALENDLIAAREVQLALQPTQLPEVPGYALAAWTRPFRGVSGDFYEVLERRSGLERVILMADVSGKGVAASLLTASLSALSAASIEEGLPAEEICGRVSRMLYSRTPPSKFATAFLGVLTPATAALRYVNAGHNPLLLVRSGSGEVARLGPTGTPLGALPAATYTTVEVTFSPGDLLVAYTDGITEAVNCLEEEYGLARLEEVCVRYRAADLPAVIDAILADVKAFSDGAPEGDDRTLLLLRRVTSP